MMRGHVRPGFAALALVGCCLLYNGARAADDIRIGVLSPLTGPTAKFGEAHKNALSLAVEEVNGAGGIPSLGGAKIKLVFGDSRGNGDTGVTETERLITEEKVVAVIGAFQSGVAMPSSAVAERRHVPWVNFATVDTLTQRGFKFIFRAHANDTLKARTLIEAVSAISAKQGTQIKNAVIMAENTDWGKSVSQKQKGFLESKGVKIDMLDNYPFASADLTSMIVKASAFKPDAVICDSYLGDALLITRTMAEQELKPAVYATGGGGHSQPDFAAGAGPLAEGVLAAVVWDAGIGARVPWIKQVNDAHVKRFGVPFTEDSAAYFQNLYLIVDALKRMKGPVTGETLRDALAATDITDQNNRAMFIPYSRLHFDQTGQNPDATAFAVQWQQGKLKLLYPDTYADASVKPIWPYPQQD